MPRTAVVALGGNAIIRAGQAGTHAEQAANARSMARAICELRDAGWVVVVVHGNGPQVGNLAIQQHEAAEEVPALPLFVQGAMTQGQLGTLLVVALHEVVSESPPVVAMVTHVVVDAADPAFGHPTKPIGPFFEEDEARRLAAERGWTIVEDSGRGYRQIVASPAPRRILEIDAVRALVERGMIVITCGGGGVPVVEHPDGYQGVDGVIDKDLTARLVATELGADALVLITDIDRVALDFGTDRQRALTDVGVEEAQRHHDEGQFPPGSMGPKMAAAIDFVRRGGQVAVITDVAHVRASLDPGDDGETGTRIVATPIGAVL
ncbi:carbamate kinase [Pseudonocardia hydrocarbonoxydans]|uniref:Carbamate kinase n=1 Tax=Pseudonocardia hydrocarbonoxydans TaxID=76726 RepID=A0A4Y3WGF3_9PSEU|nr:carbamate kinase [Pseudonocardia hydrocarbonoxydans]GEC17765.1 carbamate kinase [Pseudonocardia hydrocarbonoxydans]